MSGAALAPLFKSGPFANVPASDVPLAKIEKMLAMADLYPGTRAKLVAELARRETPNGSGAASGARPLVAQKPKPAATKAPPVEQADAETVTFEAQCPRCLSRLAATFTLAEERDDEAPF